MNEYNDEIEWDLSILESRVSQCIDINDFDQGLSLARNGYEIAIEAGIEKWMEIFENLTNNIKLKQQTLTVENDDNLKKKNEQETMQIENNPLRSINSPESKSVAKVKRKSSDLNTLDDIGSKTLEILKSNAIQSIEELASTDIKILKKIKGIGEKTAEKCINAAKSHLNQIPLNHYITSTPKEIFENEVFPSELQIDYLQELEDKLMENPQNEDLYNSKTHINELNKLINLAEEETLLLPNSKLSERDQNQIPEMELIEMTNDDIININIKKDILNDQSLLKKKEGNLELEKSLPSFQEEKLTQEKIRDLNISIEKDLRTLDYWILKKDQKRYTSLLKNIDLMAIRSFEISDFLELIILIPIKISLGKGKHRVYEEEIKYSPANRKKALKASDKRLLIDNVVEGLKDVRDEVFKNIIEEGILFRFLEKYMNNGLTIERSIARKELFLTSGQKYYEVVICPVLGVDNNVEFLESSMAPFAWQRNINLYIVDIKNIKELINYIEKKHVLIETHSIKKNLIDDYIDIHDKFFSRVTYFALPFIIYAGLLLLIATITPQILLIFIGLGFSIVILFGIGSIFFLISLLKAQNTLHNYYKTPYYQRPLNIDETGIILIKEELPQEWMHQFIYEGDMNTKQLTSVRTIEIEELKNRMNENPQFQELENDEEEESEINENEKIEKLRFRPSMVQKYSKFLED